MKRVLELEDSEAARVLLGVGDCNLKRVRDEFEVDIVARNSTLSVEGSTRAVDLGMRAFLSMLHVVRKGSELSESEVDRILQEIREENEEESGGYRRERPREDRGKPADRPQRRRVIEPHSEGQREYLKAMKENDIVFAIGPAGTGKTFLAVSQAVECLLAGDVQRLVLVRPAVEAGEHLGFLPGDYREKIHPYLQPLYDALHEMLSLHQVARYLERGAIEIAPLAYMRGRTLNSAFVILDEAQNTTPKQMKMFLTRLGFDSRAVVTGDITQVDLPDDAVSGLKDAYGLLNGIPGVSFVELHERDIVRHPLVQRIVTAYEKREQRNREAGSGGG